jgi:hypothetical protein
MGAVGEEVLLAIVDRIYGSIERPELWPETIYAIGTSSEGDVTSGASIKIPGLQAVIPRQREIRLRLAVMARSFFRALTC